MSALVRGARLDHVHLCVTDRPRSVAWYGRVLDLHVLGAGHDEVAPDHPVFLAPASQPTHHCLSLFVGDPASGGDRNVAFAVGADAFLAFARVLPDADIRAQDQTPLTAAHVNDYGLAMTFDFLDPDGNELEVVTYDTGPIRDGLRE